MSNFVTYSMELFEGVTGQRLQKALTLVVYLLGAFLLVQVMSTVQGWRYIGAGVAAANTITVSGHGEYAAVPDIATFSFTVSSTKPTAAEAQKDAATKLNAAQAYLKSAGIADKDIKTSNYSMYPQYEYQSAVCPQVQMAPVGGGSSVSYCPPGKQVLTGYQASQSTTVKVRDLTKAGDLLVGVGSKGATDVSQLNFTYDDPTGVQEAARTDAIADAKKKADTLASELGVTLVRVVSFSENSGGYPQPMLYGMAKGMAADSTGAAPSISPGENKTSDDVSITYEIK